MYNWNQASASIALYRFTALALVYPFFRPGVPPLAMLIVDRIMQANCGVFRHVAGDSDERKWIQTIGIGVGI